MSMTSNPGEKEKGLNKVVKTTSDGRQITVRDQVENSKRFQNQLAGTVAPGIFQETPPEDPITDMPESLIPIKHYEQEEEYDWKERLGARIENHKGKIMAGGALIVVALIAGGGYWFVSQNQGPKAMPEKNLSQDLPWKKTGKEVEINLSLDNDTKNLKDAYREYLKKGGKYLGKPSEEAVERIGGKLEQAAEDFDEADLDLNNLPEGKYMFKYLLAPDPSKPGTYLEQVAIVEILPSK